VAWLKGVTYNVDPFPTWWGAIFRMAREYQSYYKECADDAAEDDSQDNPAGPLSPADVEAPD